VIDQGEIELAIREERLKALKKLRVFSKRDVRLIQQDRKVHIALGMLPPSHG